MEISEALHGLHSLFQSGKHQVAGMFFWQEALEEVAMGDVDMAAQLHDALDEVSPGGSFAIWVDGGRCVGGQYVYRYDRTPEQISRVICNAAERALKRSEEAA